MPALVVTHDRMEALALGDWIAVIVNGRVRQAGPIQDVFRQPLDAEVADARGCLAGDCARGRDVIVATAVQACG